MTFEPIDMTLVDIAAWANVSGYAYARWREILFTLPTPEHFLLMHYFILVSALSFVLFLLSLLLSPASISVEKSSSYECGFEPFGDARSAFDIHFYLVGLLFLIFDLEIVFLFPWIFSYQIALNFAYMNFLTMFVFLALLGIGFVYEWRQNVLTWTTKE
jgi:NADH-quinone oxidoreductase subunit A